MYNQIESYKVQTNKRALHDQIMKNCLFLMALQILCDDDYYCYYRQ